ncbi:hypothetical protein CsSME_00007234 [Camellia sinensis var. sinensis]
MGSVNPFLELLLDFVKSFIYIPLVDFDGLYHQICKFSQAEEICTPTLDISLSASNLRDRDLLSKIFPPDVLSDDHL